MAKSKTATPKKGGGSKFDIQKFLLEKGEKIGLVIAGAAFALLALLGVIAAGSAANPSKLAGELKGGAERINSRLQATPDLKPPDIEVPKADTVVFKTVTPYQYVTPNFLFDSAGVISEKRNNPVVLSVAGGEVKFAIGSIGVWDIQNGQIATIKDMERPKNDIHKIDRFKSKKGNAAGRAPAIQQPPPPPSNPIPGGGGIGAPIGPGGGPQGPGGRGGRRPMGGMQAGGRTDEKEIVYMSIDDPAVDQAVWALNIDPRRMAVIRGVVPYKKQVEKYLAALRLPNDAALEQEGLAPIYDGFLVERQTLAADGKTIVKDWEPFDHIAAYREIRRLAADFDKEEPKIEDNFVPDPVHKLYLALPKFVRGTYPPPQMPEVGQALSEIEKTGAVKDLTTDKQKKLKGEDDIFQRPASGGNQAGPGPGAGGIPLPGGPPRGKSMAGEGRRGPPRPGGGRLGQLPAAGPSKSNAAPIWLLQFVDPTIEPGFCYKYRVKLKLKNPNYNKKDLVTSPSMAQQEILEGDWAEIPGIVFAPPEEYLYASSDTSSRGVLGSALHDTTQLRFHCWYADVRVLKDNPRSDVIGEWVIADIEAKRGQIVHQERNFKLPIWSMVKGNYIFRDRMSSGHAAGVPRWNMANVKMDFTPAVETILADFDGGKGAYRLPNGSSITDERAAEVLLITNDGKTIKLRNSVSDSPENNPERKAREEAWKAWLDEVARATENAMPNNPRGSGP